MESTITVLVIQVFCHGFREMGQMTHPLINMWTLVTLMGNEFYHIAIGVLKFVRTTAPTTKIIRNIPLQTLMS